MRCWSATPSVVVTAVTARRPERAREFAEHHGIGRWHAGFDELLRSDVDVVDLCVPNHLHRDMAVEAADACKHIICTKPLSAYVGQDLPDDCDDDRVSQRERRAMWEVAQTDALAMVAAAEGAGVRLLYGENWVFAPSFTRALGLLARSGGAVLEMRGGESHSGSHSPYSKSWRNTGGGALLRLGSHAVGAMVFLKRVEGLRLRGTPIVPVAVSAEVADLSRVSTLEQHDERLRVARGWVDVENWGAATITFDDGSRAVAWGSDNVLGGMESRLELMASNCRLRCNLSPGDMLEAFAPDAEVFGDAYLLEKLDSGAGWSTPMPDEDWTSGQLGMCQAFARCLSAGERCDCDGRLGLDVVRVIYAAYVAAAEGRRVQLDELPLE